jgi:ATP-binding cassette subfamily B protein
MPAHTGLGLYRRLMSEARPYSRHIAGLFALSFLSTAFALLTPLPLKIAVDSVVGSHPLPGFLSFAVPAGVRHSQTALLLLAAALFVLLAVLKQLQQFATLVLSTYAGQKLLLQFRSRLFRHAERLSLSYHDSKGTADSAYRIQYDAMAIQNIAVTALIPLFTAVLTVAGMVYVTAMIDWQLALVSLGVAPVLFLAMRLYRMRLRKQWHDAKRLESSALSVVQESLQALRVVKAFGREDDQRDRFVEHSTASVRANIGVSAVEGRFGIVVGVTIGLGMGLVLFLGTRRVLADAMTLGELVLVMGYLQQLYDPLKTASKKAGALQSALASAERVYSLLDEAPDVVDPADALPLERAAGAVTFRNVSFAYGGGARVLDDVSFEVRPGARLGIAGASGAGKTTLVNLLARFYDPTDGEILIDGVDVRRYRLADLRNQFAIVLQEPVLFSTSIAENIAYARVDASAADVVAAAEAAGADAFIRALPEGYDTAVGERGAQLSGGERQRIALARAFLKDAPILILDEPTSSVDAPTEAQILQAMERLMSGRTTLLIAHRPSTLEHCEARVELEHGRLAATAPRRRAPRRRRKRFPVRCDASHPVVRAWHTVSMRGRVDRVDLLHARTKSSVYRLVWDGGARSVIAKRGQIEALRVERRIYASVLPRLSSPALSYYGFLPENPREFAWLFIEDAGDEPCSLGQAGSLAARWLGTLHGAAAALDSAEWLPDRGPASYLEHLRGGRRTILANCNNAALGPEDRARLQAIVTACDLIELSWDGVDAICRSLPRTLVHGDLVAKNLRLRRHKRSRSLLALDWERAGWGVPAADAYLLGLEANRKHLADYRSLIGDDARVLSPGDLRALSFAGKGFRLLASVDWASSHLAHRWPEKAMASLREYEQPLGEWAHELAAATR